MNSSAIAHRPETISASGKEISLGKAATEMRVLGWPEGAGPMPADVKIARKKSEEKNEHVQSVNNDSLGSSRSGSIGEGP
jgi:hypothetical protein